jgi:hypothetical protein
MTVSLNSPNKKPFDSVKDVGAVIQILTARGISWQHSGILYKCDGEEARVFHLADHFDSRDEPPENEWRWVQADLPEINRRLVAVFAKKIASRKDKLQFGFAFDGDAFTLEGEYLKQPSGTGLTCATVILKIFERLGIHILKCEEWKTRPDDMEWQRRQVNRFRDTPVLAEKLAEHIGDPRFRPDEVTAGVGCDHHPVGFEEAVELASRLARDLERSYRAPQSSRPRRGR